MIPFTPRRVHPISQTDGWTIVIPVKPPSLGKTRLARPDDVRASLALAIALDTIEATAAASRVTKVLVVTNDSQLERLLAPMPSVSVIAEMNKGGLNAAVAVGAAAAGVDVRRAALLSDLPALHPAELDAALAGAESVNRGLVPDSEGAGSTLVTARGGAVWTSSFGADSAARHRLLGCSDLAVPSDSGLRRDVDTIEQLKEAAALGLGPRTAALVTAELFGVAEAS